MLAPAPVTAEARTLHEALFAAADAADIAAFKAVLSGRSVLLLDRYFTSVRALDANGRHGWADLLSDHRDLPAVARARAPYPVVREGANQRLDLAAAADAAYFADTTRRLARKGPGDK